ncbi:MAG: sigma-70 family RNA polymerase sigma factor, partial [Actinomycetota bacterium]
MSASDDGGVTARPRRRSSPRRTVEQEIEHLARHDAGRVLAAIARRFGDLDLADDAVQDSLIEATVRWPDDGIPTNPPAWLHQVARRKAIDALRRASSADRRTRRVAHELAIDTEPAAPGSDGRSEREDADGNIVMIDDGIDLGDERLRLILLCCHPALDRDGQVALTLRLVAGLTTDEIAAAFLVPTPTIAQRITRAKRKIRDAGIPMHLPQPPAASASPDTGDADDPPTGGPLATRLGFVHTVLYLIFNEGYLSRSGASGSHRVDLCAEAIRLAEIAGRLDGDDPETLGLLALMRFVHARRHGRVVGDHLVLLDDQDRTSWKLDEIRTGNDDLRHAFEQRRPGRYQLQAAIASYHSNARTADETDWPRIVALYDQLVALDPTPVVGLNREVAVAMADGPDAGLRALDALGDGGGDRGRLDDFHLAHSTRGELLARTGRRDEAIESFERALERVRNPAERELL